MLYCTGRCKSAPGLELPTERVTGLGCIPEGRSVSYQCTVSNNGLAATVWQGSAFNCTSSSFSAKNQITLLHSRYSAPMGVMGICGDFSAMSVNFTARVQD